MGLCRHGTETLYSEGDKLIRIKVNMTLIPGVLSLLLIARLVRLTSALLSRHCETARCYCSE